MSTAPIFVLVDDKHIPVYRGLRGSPTCRTFAVMTTANAKGITRFVSNRTNRSGLRGQHDSVLKAVEAWYNGEQQGGHWPEEP